MTAYQRLLITALLSAVLSACATAPAPNKQTLSTMTNESNAATQPTAVTSTFCMGRFLIDMAVGSALSGGNYKYDFTQLEKPVTMTFEQFERDVATREAKLKSAKHKKEPSLLRQSLQTDKSTRVLAFWEHDFLTTRVKIEGHRWIDGVRFLIKDEVDDDKQNFGMTRMRDALSRLRPRTDTDIPTDPGYCFEGGFIANERWRNEESGVDIDIPGHPDAFVSVWIYPLASHKHDKPLLERMGGALQQLSNLGTAVRVLRQGERQIGPYKGQEYLVSAPNSGGMRAHSFVWETQGEGTLDTPSIKIELTTGHRDSKGNPQQTRLSNEQALELWDEIVGSFRLRPTGAPPARTGAAAPPRLPLGELAATDHTCPQTGWWQCADSGEVQGGRRQRFETGAPMPHAVLLGKPNVWQKLTGERPAYPMATVWQLVAYDEAPEPVSATPVGTAPLDASAPLAQGDSPDPALPQADAAGEDEPPRVG